MIKLEVNSSNLFDAAHELEKFLVVEPRNAIALQAVFSAHKIENAFDEWMHDYHDFSCKEMPSIFVNENGVLYLDGYKLLSAGEEIYAENSENYIMLFSADYIYVILPLITEEENSCYIKSVEVYYLVDSRRRNKNIV